MMRNTLRMIVLGVSLLASGAFTRLSAQEARLAGRIADDARAQLDAILVTARSEGLPTEPLVDRALEGAAKRARPDLIVNAVNRLLDELRAARVAFGTNATPAELTAGASALRAGATRNDLARLRRLRPKAPLTIPAGVLADLVAAGVPADTGIAAVLALATNADDADYIAFRRNVERDIALGASPSSSVGARLRAVGDLSTGGVGAAAPPRGETSGNTPPPPIPRKRKP